MAEATRTAQGPRIVSFFLRLTSFILALWLTGLLVVETGLLPAGEQAYHDLAAAVAPVSLFKIAMYLHFGFLILWTGLANKAVRETVTEDLQSGPWMAAFWYLIPIASLFKPYGVVKEIYQASRNPTDWKDSGQVKIILIWWFLQIAILLIGLVIRLLSAGNGLVSLNALLQLTLVVWCVLTIIIVTRVTRWLANPVKATAADVF